MLKVALRILSTLSWSTLSSSAPAGPSLEVLIRRNRLLSRVIVEAAARLAAKVPCIDQLAQALGLGEAVLPVGVRHHVGDRGKGVQADEVGERERTHRVAGPGHHPGVDVGDRADALLMGA